MQVLFEKKFDKAFTQFLLWFILIYSVDKAPKKASYVRHQSSSASGANDCESAKNTELVPAKLVSDHASSVAICDASSATSG